MELILVRHGQTEWNKLHRTQGQQDSPLTVKGTLQADLTGKALSSYHIDRFYCSDAGRAVQTAGRILKINPDFPLPKADPRLRELNYGNWEGMLHDEIKHDNPELYSLYRNDPASFRAPNGESFENLQNRFISFLAELTLDENGTCLVVSHKGLLRIAMLTLTKRRIAEMRNLPSIAEASITRLRKTFGTWTLLESSNTQHLGQLDDEKK